MLLDPSVNTSYVEDCEVCCNPIEIYTSFDNGVITSFEAINIEQ